MQTYLISFATPDYYWIQDKLNHSVVSNNIKIDKIVSYRDTFLNSDTLQYCKNNPRGFGFWRWKSIILNDIFSKIEYGDRVLYLDSGNTVRPELNIFLDYNHSDIVLFENKDANFQNEVWRTKQWTRRDCYILMDCDEEKYWNGKQVNASFQFYTKTDRTIDFLKKFENYCDDHLIISDHPSQLGSEYPEFGDHRHDQAILSLLALKHDVDLLSDPSESGNNTPNRQFPQLFNHCRRG